jgi:hypothetical protein
MNRKEQFKRNHELFKLFIQQSIDSPDLREQVPDEADLLFLPDNDPELREANTRLAEELRTAGKKPTFIRVSYVAETSTVMVPKMELVETA